MAHQVGHDAAAWRPRRLTASARPMTGCDLQQIAHTRPASRYGDRQHHAE